ncbi:MAG: Ig-like domain-containing protein, partial [Verrucomicrobiae bacterium]|nr:Ig-like domain-containing protein [Verrucomicrobiae bacterium]
MNRQPMQDTRLTDTYHSLNLPKQCSWKQWLRFVLMWMFWIGPAPAKVEVAPLVLRADTGGLTLIETPPASRFFTASTTNAFDGIGSSLADEWSFDVEAGATVSARVEAAIGNARPKMQLVTPSGSVIKSVDGGSDGIAEFHRVEISVPGNYKLRLYTDNQVSAYRLRVDLSLGPRLEIETNNSAGTANVLEPEFLAGTFRFPVAGVLTAGDTADFFALGTLDVGNVVTAELFTGPYSSLQPGDVTIGLFRSGNTNAVFLSTTNFSHVIAERGDYLVRLTAATNHGLFARYLLTVTVADNVPPTVSAVTLPAENTVSTEIINQVTLTFSEPMLPASITNAANFSLYQAGADGVFDTADDIPYLLLPARYAGGLTAVLTITNGPLQPGKTRFVVT